VVQVWLPLRASRLILATDSVFNAFDTFHKAAGALRDVSLTNAAAALLRCSQQHKRHRHDFVDASVLVVDFVPHNFPPFKSQVRDLSWLATAVMRQTAVGFTCRISVAVLVRCGACLGHSTTATAMMERAEEIGSHS
jgi:hypothetical protein